MNTSLFTLPRPWPLAALAVFGGLSGTPAYAVTCTGGLQPTNPDSIYTVHGDGTVTDTRTGLMWKTCLEGQSGSDCDQGNATAMDWAAALAAAQTANASPGFAGHTNWRLPNIKELQSLTEYCRSSPALNDSIFKNVPSTAWAWSGTPAQSSPLNEAYFVSLGDGGISVNPRLADRFKVVRLVRDVQPAGPVNGACGSAHNTGTTPLLTSAPGSGLCSAGTPSSVTGGTSTFTWNCAGSGTGSTSASCQAPRGYTVTPSAGANGSISPSTAQTVAYNATPSFTLSPDSGYVVDAVAGTCGGNLTGSSYTTAAVTQDCTVEAVFKTAPPIDTTPDAFSFTPQTGVARSTLVQSNAITVSGINSTAAISVSGGEYQIGSGSWSSSAGTVNNGDTVRLRHTSNAGYSSTATTTLTIGGVQASFTSTTEAAPPPPPPAPEPEPTPTPPPTPGIDAGGASAPLQPGQSLAVRDNGQGGSRITLAALIPDSDPATVTCPAWGRCRSAAAPAASCRSCLSRAAATPCAWSAAASASAPRPAAARCWPWPRAAAPPGPFGRPVPAAPAARASAWRWSRPAATCA